MHGHSSRPGLAGWLLLLRVLLLACGIGGAAPALAQSCSAATTQGTAPAAWQTYCWLDFSTYNDTTARSTGGQNFSFTLVDGSVLSLNLRITPNTAPGMTAIAAPSWTGAAVGNTAFLGIPGRPVLYTAASGTKTVTIRNIAITPPPGAPAVTAYSVVIADAESTDNAESIQTVTNGSNWALLDTVPPITGNQFPTLAGIGSATVTMGGGGLGGNVGGYIVGSNSPTQVTTTLNAGGLQGIMVAVRFASVRLTKQIVGTRIDPADQFGFRITATGTGTTLASGTTSGTGLGPFNAAGASLASGVPLTLSETMAGGSVSAISQYRSTLTCVNTAAGSATPLPSNVETTSFNLGALSFGDNLLCTFTNQPFPHIRLRKALAPAGRAFAGDQFTVRLAQGTTTVAQSVTTGTGSIVAGGDTGLVRVTAGTGHTIEELPAGTANLALYTVATSCTNANGTSPTVLPATQPATVTPALGDVITCTITNTRRSTALLQITKASQIISDPVNGTTNPKRIPGAVIEYSIGVTNVGNVPVDASTIVIEDPLPAGLVFDAATSVQFANGSPASGLSAFNAATMVGYSSQPAGGAPYAYTPGSGFDPAVRGIRIAPSGTMAASNGTAHPGFTVRFRVRLD